MVILVRGGVSGRLLFSIVVPRHGSLSFLPGLFSAVPGSSELRVVLISGSPAPVDGNSVTVSERCVLLRSKPRENTKKTQGTNVRGTENG